jgi:16S rRNA (cytosine967-C5)-methyltransferase
LVSVQDAAAQWAAPLLDLSPDLRVLDACAAPGGKTAHLLELADATVCALDHDETRLQRVRSNLTRLGLDAHLICADAAKPEVWWDGVAFDRVLADVPCSASGVVRRHPDIKWLRRASDLQQFVLQQQRLLDALWRVLATGGKLLYSTCSVFREENHNQIAQFLERHADAHHVRFEASSIVGEHEGQIFPDAWHDGFYYALLQKH